MKIRVTIPATPVNFDEQEYLSANPDVAAAVRRGEIESGRQHFEIFGIVEGRRLHASVLDVLRHARRSVRLRRPVPVTEAPRSDSALGGQVACVAVVKNAEPRIAEWLAYQFAIGFQAAVVLDNASTDRTAEIVGKFSGRYDVRLLEWPMTGRAYQVRGYEYALWSVRDEFAWCACIDDDEFIVPPDGQSVADMLSHVDPEVDAIALPWAVFGSNGLVEPPHDLVIASYTRRAPEEFSANRFVKSIVRPSRVRGCLNAHVFQVPGAYASTRGDRLTLPKGATQHTVPFAGGKVHHYFVRSRACWTEKLARGYPDTTRQEAEFEKFDRNDIVDDSARRFEGAVREILRGVGF